MPSLALLATAFAHPPPSARLADDAHERLADALVLGPPGCFVADAAVDWTHRSGGFVTAGRAATRWRFEDRVWTIEERVVLEADPDSVDVRVAPLLHGVSVAVDLRYPTTPGRTVDWPGPSATLPVRLFGEIETLAIDTLADGGTRVVRAFEWDGWKRVSGERRVTFPSEGPTVVQLLAVDRWPNGCRVRSEGTSTVGPRGLPSSEVWRFEGSCPLRDWSGDWRFVFDAWTPCATTGAP